MNDNSKKYVFLVEDDDELRTDLERTLRVCGYAVFAFADAEAFLIWFKPVLPAVLVTDMRMSKKTGIQLQSELAEKGCKMPIIFISGESSDQQIVKAFKNGAFDFLLKPFSVEVFLNTIHRALDHDASENQKREDQNTASEILKILTPRERQVFDLLAKGYSNGELVETLGIAMPTVKQYKFEVMQKLKLRSISELIALNSSLIRDWINPFPLIWLGHPKEPINPTFVGDIFVGDTSVGDASVGF